MTLAKERVRRLEDAERDAKEARFGACFLFAFLFFFDCGHRRGILRRMEQSVTGDATTRMRMGNKCKQLGADLASLERQLQEQRSGGAGGGGSFGGSAGNNG